MESSSLKNERTYIPYAITFLAGASYGLTTVVIGQPLDTIKTRMQGIATTSNASVTGATSMFRDLYGKEGIKGLYRGGLPLIIGGSLMRSAQFGVSAEAKGILDRCDIPSVKIFGIIDSSVLISGIAGGMGRALVEIPTDFFKIRRQVQSDLNTKLVVSEIWKQSLDGSSVTMFRNSILFASFIVYIDLSKQLVSNGYVPSILCTDDLSGLSPFAKGAICSNLAWLTCWPLDVVKTQRQSGNFNESGKTGILQLLKSNYKSGVLLRGLVPGLIRSSLSNGSSMVVYEYVHSTLSDLFGVTRTDIV